ncbi:acyl-CoA dehydrogenase family protein, partial [Protofrankia symbiont of Coriaria ruscifolia]|uniref:acyl-CoA dehydrogenase family protein n=1 Tax=Protofrankia symbiont of Coriaria ruscifolia TaxID=1306542 RepID=UPI0013EF78F8
MSENRLNRSPVLDEPKERRALRESVGRLVDKYGRSYFQDVARRQEFTHELWADLGQAGFLGVQLPEEHGGGGGG